MSLDLPKPIAAYFEAKRRHDPAGILAPFADDAVVEDERRTHRGREEIRAWIEETTVAYKVVPDIREVARDADAYLVTAEISGTFPGSPVTLTYRLRLAGDRIAHLVIA